MLALACAMVCAMTFATACIPLAFIRALRIAPWTSQQATACATSRHRSSGLTARLCELRSGVFALQALSARSCVMGRGFLDCLDVNQCVAHDDFREQ